MSKKEKENSFYSILFVVLLFGCAVSENESIKSRKLILRFQFCFVLPD
jgi:hypothetical protein